MRADITIELETIRIVANSKSPKLVEQLNEEWFTNLPCRYAVAIWKANYDNLEFINFSAYAREKGYKFTKDEFESVYELPMGDTAIESCSKILRRKYQQRLIDKKLEEVRAKIYSMDPSEAEAELMTYFKNEEVIERAKTRKITEGFGQENFDLLVLGGKYRPELDNIMPMRKSIITIGADSGMHKSNQVLNMLILFIKNNPGRKAIFFSFEMEFNEVQARIFSTCLNIDLKSIIRRKDTFGVPIDVNMLVDRMNAEHPDIVENLLVFDALDFKKNSDISRIIIQQEPDVWALDFLQYYAQMQSGNQAGEQNVNVMETIAFSKVIAQVTNSLGAIVSQIKKIDRLSIFPRINDLEWSGLTKQLSHSIAMLFWGFKHNNKKAPRDYFLVSWQKVRNGELWNETARVFPETCSFTYPYPMQGLNFQQKQVLKNIEDM